MTGAWLLMATGCSEGTGGERAVVALPPTSRNQYSEELSLKNSHEQVKSQWVRLRDRSNKGNLVVGVYYRLTDQGEATDKAFFLQLQEASCLQSLVLPGDFNHLDICWKSSMVSCRQSRRFLECIEDNFLSQVISTPT